MPAPPYTCKAPVLVDVDEEVLATITGVKNVPLEKVKFGADRLPVTVMLVATMLATPVILPELAVLPTFNVPPILTLPPTPTPPHTCRAPVLVLVLVVVFDITNVLVVPVVRKP